YGIFLLYGREAGDQGDRRSRLLSRKIKPCHSELFAAAFRGESVGSLRDTLKSVATTASVIHGPFREFSMKVCWPKACSLRWRALRWCSFFRRRSARVRGRVSWRVRQ